MRVRPFSSYAATAHSATSGWRNDAVLDLERRHPDAADLEQVVGPALVPEVPVRVADEEVARCEPVAGEDLLRLLVVAPVAERRALAAKPKLARFTGGNFPAVLADDERFVPRAHLAEAAHPGARRDGWRCRCGTPRRSRSRRAPRCRRPRASACVPPLAAPPRLMCRAEAKTGHARAPPGDWPSRYHRRHLDHHRRPMLFDQLEETLGRRAFREDHPCCADAEVEQRRSSRGRSRRTASARAARRRPAVSPSTSSAYIVERDDRVVRGVDGAPSAPPCSRL